LIFLARVPLNTFTLWHHRLDLSQFSVPGFEGYFYMIGMMLAMISFAKIQIEKNIFSIVGGKSMSIFIFHLYFISLANKYLFHVAGYESWIAMVIFSTAGSIIISL